MGVAKRELGRTGLHVTALGYGAMELRGASRARDITEVQAEITTRTCEVLGRAINPHLFRDCVATSIAIEDPRHIGIAWRLLGHRSPSTTEMYYNQARSVEASRRLQGYLLSLRSRIGRLNWSNFSPNDRDIGRQ